eukprot:SAG31_NODE_2259_length_6068_cov_10.272240_2_plen_317_part_00
MPAVPKQPWHPAVMDGTTEGPSCWQDGDRRNTTRYWREGKRRRSIESEDCLWLEVWRPTSARADQSLPVTVWIHGAQPQIDRIATRDKLNGCDPDHRWRICAWRWWHQYKHHRSAKVWRKQRHYGRRQLPVAFRLASVTLASSDLDTPAFFAWQARSAGPIGAPRLAARNGVEWWGKRHQGCDSRTAMGPAAHPCFWGRSAKGDNHGRVLWWAGGLCSGVPDAVPTHPFRMFFSMLFVDRLQNRAVWNCANGWVPNLTWALKFKFKFSLNLNLCSIRRWLVQQRLVCFDVRIGLPVRAQENGAQAAHRMALACLLI